ncbi:MAG: rhomboid family intramembrane serine protease [Verrucomicrobiota bacterium]
MIIPHRVEVLHPVWPITNFIVIGLCVITTGLWLYSDVVFLDHLILEGWNPIDMALSALLHADFLHLLFNMLFLWVFGNAICAKFGNLKFLAIFFGGAMGASLVHLIMDGSPCVGASGAINAVIGVFLVLYPVNRIHCAYWIFFAFGSFSIKAYWLIAFWFGTDIFGAFFQEHSDVAFWAHIGGLLVGIGIGFYALATNSVEMADVDNETLPDLLFRKKKAGDYEIPERSRRIVRESKKAHYVPVDSPEVESQKVSPRTPPAAEPPLDFKIKPMPRKSNPEE